MNNQAPYEHEQVEGFDKLTNLEVCVDMETILQTTQTQQVEETLQQSQTQQVSLKPIVNVPKMSIYSKRSSSYAMGTSDEQISPKKMNISQSP
jgi:L-fucose mutarotase/ribose pyranase (RbsD/FucU family)